jgi:hypothetical protein
VKRSVSRMPYAPSGSNRNKPTKPTISYFSEHQYFIQWNQAPAIRNESSGSRGPSCSPRETICTNQFFPRHRHPQLLIKAVSFYTAVDITSSRRPRCCTRNLCLLRQSREGFARRVRIWLQLRQTLPRLSQHSV